MSLFPDFFVVIVLAAAASAFFVFFCIIFLRRKHFFSREMALEIERVHSEVERLANTLATLDLTHVEALRLLGGRLDRIEVSLDKINQRLEALEK